MEYVLELSNVIKNYEDFKLDNISFSVPRGCICGFIGQNGSAQLVALRLKKYNLIYFTVIT